MDIFGRVSIDWLATAVIGGAFYTIPPFILAIFGGSAIIAKDNLQLCKNWWSDVFEGNRHQFKRAWMMHVVDAVSG